MFDTSGNDIRCQEESPPTPHVCIYLSLPTLSCTYDFLIPPRGHVLLLAPPPSYRPRLPLPRVSSPLGPSRPLHLPLTQPVEQRLLRPRTFALPFPPVLITNRVGSLGHQDRNDRLDPPQLRRSNAWI